jgi:hypothetical protein
VLQVKRGWKMLPQLSLYSLAPRPYQISLPKIHSVYFLSADEGVTSVSIQVIRPLLTLDLRCQCCEPRTVCRAWCKAAAPLLHNLMKRTSICWALCLWQTTFRGLDRHTSCSCHSSLKQLYFSFTHGKTERLRESSQS